jgi:hypothetical protein
MRRTGSEEIGSSKVLGRRKDSWRTEAFAFSDFFGEAPELRPWILKHDDAGRSLPGFIFAFVFYLVDLPTDCAIEPLLLARERLRRTPAGNSRSGMTFVPEAG